MKYEFIQYCKENKRTVALVFFICLVCIALQIASYASHSNNYIVNDHGQVVAISRGNGEASLSLPLQVEVKQGKTSLMEKVVLFFEGEKVKKQEKPTDTNEAKSLQMELQYLADQISQSDKEIVALPKATEDGLALKWQRDERYEKSFVLFILAPIVLFLFYRMEKERHQKIIAEQMHSIRCELPAMNSQLLLLLNSGLIFNDAFNRIGESYLRRDKKISHLGKVILDIMEKSKKTNISLVLSFDEEAKRLGIKELSRMSGIILDNQYKGVSLKDKLSNERELLWNQRKKMAEERGKLAETKLAFPLAILLMVLIVVTSAPAILQI